MAGITHFDYGGGIIAQESVAGNWLMGRGPSFPTCNDRGIAPPNGAVFWRTDFRAWYVWDRPTQTWNLAEAGAENFDKGGNVVSPVAPFNAPVWRAPFPCTVIGVSGYRVGGTAATVNARRNGSATHLAADLDLSAADTWFEDTTVQNTAYAEGDSLEIMIVTATGATQVVVLVEFRRS